MCIFSLRHCVWLFQIYLLNQCCLNIFCYIISFLKKECVPQNWNLNKNYVHVYLHYTASINFVFIDHFVFSFPFLTGHTFSHTISCQLLLWILKIHMFWQYCSLVETLVNLWSNKWFTFRCNDSLFARKAVFFILKCACRWILLICQYGLFI